MSLSFSGFNDKLPAYIKSVAESIAAFVPDDEAKLAKFKDVIGRELAGACTPSARPRVWYAVCGVANKTTLWLRRQHAISHSHQVLPPQPKTWPLPSALTNACAPELKVEDVNTGSIPVRAAVPARRAIFAASDSGASLLAD